MHPKDTPSRAEDTGLSTDDIARTHETRTHETAEGQSAPPPTYPGESIAVGEDTGRSVGEDTSRSGGEDTAGADRRGAADESPQLMDSAAEEDFRTRWRDIQSLFVDDPREAVHSADSLVADVMQKLAATFAEHRRTLEGQWKEGADVDTESLRTALRQYRSFFNRLLTTGQDQAGTG
ncbi:hypothetical protein ACIGO8_10600 [Streptomyces sp. NPDC053493]|uniref:hypothetical protein n=1 Tax=Streptomyces sp. NPDC053493 TaxID=3365705 RepID=UPI0037D521EC